MLDPFKPFDPSKDPHWFMNTIDWHDYLKLGQDVWSIFIEKLKKPLKDGLRSSHDQKKEAKRSILRLRSVCKTTKDQVDKNESFWACFGFEKEPKVPLVSTVIRQCAWLKTKKIKDLNFTLNKEKRSIKGKLDRRRRNLVDLQSEIEGLEAQLEVKEVCLELNHEKIATIEAESKIKKRKI
jgi:hypothetical protein